MPLNASTWTQQKLVTVVSRFVGLANDSNSRSVIVDHINLALWELNLHNVWDWNAIVAANITVSASTSTYSLPTGSGEEFDEVYDVRLIGGAERTLDPIGRREYDRLARGEQDNTSTPTHYYIYGAQQNAVITLVPTPSAADTLSVRYFRRQEDIADITASGLAMSDKYIPLVVYRAAQLSAYWKNDEARGDRFGANYITGLKRALQVDRDKPDTMPTIIPQIEHQVRRLDYINPTDEFYEG